MGTAQYDLQGRELVPGLEFADGHHIDAFNRLRVSDAETLWDTQFEYNLHPLFYHANTANNGTITHDAADSGAHLNAATDSASQATLQTYEYFRYQPGKSQQVVTTFLFAAATTDLDQRAGLFDDENGFFLELSGSTVNIVRRTKTSGSVVNNKTAQASWNIDVMDGSGPSGHTLDLTKLTILHIDFTPFDRIRYGIKNDGELHYVHEELIANTLAVPGVTTPNLPVRWQVITTGVIAGARTMAVFAVSVTSEGGQHAQTGHPFSFGREVQTAADNVEEAFIGFRVATTLNSITFRGKISPRRFGLEVSGSGCRWRLRYIPTTTTGVSFQSPVTHSAMETDIATTAISGGVVIDQGFIAAGQGNQFNEGGVEEILERLPLTLDPDGTTQTITLFITIEGVGGTTTVRGAMHWEEVR